MKFQLEDQSYEDWKADRQVYLDSRSTLKVFLDEKAYEKYNTDEYYYGLADEIKARQESKIPIPGEGSVIFFTEITRWGKPLTKLGWPARIIYGVFEGMEQWFKYKTGIEYD